MTNDFVKDILLQNKFTDIETFVKTKKNQQNIQLIVCNH